LIGSSGRINIGAALRRYFENILGFLARWDALEISIKY